MRVGLWKPVFGCTGGQETAESESISEKVNRWVSVTSQDGPHVYSANTYARRARTLSAHFRRRRGPSAFPSQRSSTKNFDRRRDNKRWKWQSQSHCRQTRGR